ncbi:MAG: two-component regulator propeller domain-containing protein, partial [Muribaculaceae bacterium]
MNRFLMCDKFKSWVRSSVFAMVLAMPGVAAAINGTMYDCSRLASSLVTKVCQDKYGLVWVATDFGLSKFDGYNFVNYYHDSSDTTTIVGNIITTFVSTNEGEMFIGCGKGLMRYDYETDDFVSYRFPGGKMPRVNSIVESQNGTLFVSTAGHGVFSLDKQRRELRPRKEFETLTGSRYLSIRHGESSGHIWIQTSSNNMMRCRLDGDKPADVQRIAVGGQLVDIVGEPGGGVLIATQQEILRFDPRTGKTASAGFVLPDDLTIASLHIDRSGNIFIGSISQSLYIIRNGERVAQEEQIYNRQFLMPHLTINSIMQDKDGNIWLTSPRHGLYLCSTKTQKFHSWCITLGGERLADGVGSIASSPDGGLYCTVNNKGLFHIDGNGHPTRVAGAPSSSSYIFRDSNGGYWLGTWSGLYRFDVASGRGTLFADLKNKGTLNIAEDREGRIYYTVFGDGFAIYDRRTGKTLHYNTRRQPKRRGAR